MHIVTRTTLQLRKPRWIIAKFVETTQPVTENVLNTYDRMKKPKPDMDKLKSAELTNSTRNEHSFTNLNVPAKVEKVQRDVFGATILPSNLSFDNMKKLSMNQIKLEEIPLVDENNVAEIMMAERMHKAKESEPQKKPAETPKPEVEKKEPFLDFTKADPFERIPGPRIMQSLTSIMRETARQMSVYLILNVLRTGPAFRKYGSIVRLPGILGGKLLLINRPELIMSVFEQDKQNLCTSCIDTLECSRLRRHKKDKIRTVSNENDWEETRKAIDDVLLKEEEKYFDGLEENGYYILQRIRSMKNPENEVPNAFLHEINKWGLESMFQILFDKPLGCLDPDLMQNQSKTSQLFSAICQATKSLRSCENGLQLWRFMTTTSSNSLDNACQTIEDIISQHVYQSQMNLLNKDDDLKSEALTFTEGMLLLDGITRADVVTHVMDTILIGMNATTTALAFLLYHLACHPRIQAELFKELKTIMPEKYTRIELDQVRSMKYLRACLKESLRLKMPMPILSKFLNRDVILRNYQVPRGTMILMPAQLEALRDENFVAAQEFRPGRWLDPENVHPFTSLPLSTYSKNKFEVKLAETAILTCAALIIRNFIVGYHYGPISCTHSTISYPNSPLRLSFFERDT